MVAYLAVNTFLTLWFSRDTEIYTAADVLMSVLCCALPIIPFCYAYRWCNKFVRGEI